mgnify:CR=1 FL=1
MQPQAQRQVAVQFDDGEAPQALHQGLGQSSQAGPDFNHGLARQGGDGRDDAVDDAVVGQEMLPEALAGDVFQRGLACLVTEVGDGCAAANAATGVYWGGSRYSTYARPRSSCAQVA